MTTLMTSLPQREQPTSSRRLRELRELALRGLQRMYRPEHGLYAFRARRCDGGVRLEGTSARYSAIVLLALARESEPQAKAALGGRPLAELCDRLLNTVPGTDNLGDTALILWAALALRHPATDAAAGRVGELLTKSETLPTVELAWALSAFCEPGAPEYVAPWRDEAARRLMGAFRPQAELFPHHVGGTPARLRGHVACFADQVYPIQALARYAAMTADLEPLDAARRCADRICRCLGPGGQWCWHYDVRTGRVVEVYPVYSVHQDGMAPMALFALAEAGGPAYDDAMRRGLDWLYAVPELGGTSLIEPAADMIWRKVARREPRKLVRRAQAVATRVHPRLRWPGMDALFPAHVIDDECRPYHLGWLLYAWPAARAAAWDREAGVPS